MKTFLWYEDIEFEIEYTKDELYTLPAIEQVKLKGVDIIDLLSEYHLSQIEQKLKEKLDPD